MNREYETPESSTAMKNSKQLAFDLSNEFSTLALARLLAEYEKQGVTYKVNQNAKEVYVELTGGF